MKGAVKKLLLFVSVPVLSLIPAISLPTPTSANSETSFVCFGTPGGGGEDGGVIGGTGYARLKEAVKQFGETAMDMQREWGTPWEVVFAQMQKESGTGSAGVAVTGAHNNWLGITGSGDAGTYYSGRNWAVYSSVDASIRDWAGPRVLRNGYYDAAFPHLNPLNYNIMSFLSVMINVYAPPSDGNNPAAYLQDVMSFINGPINEAREEMGWPSSAELARNENIPIGGRHPIGSPIDGGEGVTSGGGCSSGGGRGGNISEMAIKLSWPDRSHAKNDPKPEYDNAMGTVDTRIHCTAPKMGDSCDVFVATVYRMTVDPDFPCCGVVSMRAALRSSDKYELVVDGQLRQASTADLRPGDIMILDGHIMIYATLEDGRGVVAEASACDRTAEHAGSVYFSDWRGNYDVLRWKG